MFKSKRIIPAILVKTEKEFKEKVSLVSPFVQQVQIDAMDNEFVPNLTFFDPFIISKMGLAVNYEVHFMVSRRNLHLKDWQGLANRLIVHYEICPDSIGEVLEEIKSLGMEAGLAVSPDTKVEAVKHVIALVDYFLILTVVPGFSGQSFLEYPLKKAEIIKKWQPSIKVGVDGGIGLQTISLAAKAGVDFFSVNSAIYKKQDIKKSIFELEQKI